MYFRNLRGWIFRYRGREKTCDTALKSPTPDNCDFYHFSIQELIHNNFSVFEFENIQYTGTQAEPPPLRGGAMPSKFIP